MQNQICDDVNFKFTKGQKENSTSAPSYKLDVLFVLFFVAVVVVYFCIN